MNTMRAHNILAPITMHPKDPKMGRACHDSSRSMVSLCGKRALSSPWTPTSPDWGSDTLWKAGHRHPPSAFPQGLENPYGVFHSSPASTTRRKFSSSHPLISYRGTWMHIIS